MFGKADSRSAQDQSGQDQGPSSPAEEPGAIMSMNRQKLPLLVIGSVRGNTRSEWQGPGTGAANSPLGNRTDPYLHTAPVTLLHCDCHRQASCSKASFGDRQTDILKAKGKKTKKCPAASKGGIRLSRGPDSLRWSEEEWPTDSSTWFPVGG